STKPKINRVCEDYIQPVWKDRENLINFFYEQPTLAAAHEFLGHYPGLAGTGFMAAQIIADLKYTKLLVDAPDWWTWCCLGTGSRRGLNRLLGRPPEGPVPKNWHEEVLRFQSLVRQRLPHIPLLCAQNIQNCFCEMSKLERVLEGGGTKRTYPGRK